MEEVKEHRLNVPVTSGPAAENLPLLEELGMSWRKRLGSEPEFPQQGLIGEMQESSRPGL